MLLTISTTYQPATDLGYLFYKNPTGVQSFDLTFGTACVFYPEATAAKCTVALLLDVDPIKLVRGKGGSQAFDQYVNDRPYVASSFLSVAIAEVFGSALSGKSKERQELADSPIPLTAQIAVLPCRGGEQFLRRLFEPLGYEVEVQSYLLDGHFPDWGDSHYFTVSLRGTKRLSELLRHLYVLIPVLDDAKHYWVGDAEIEKLLRHGKDWLSEHPEREAIARRYLKNRRSLAHEALVRLTESESLDPDVNDAEHTSEEASLEARISLNEQRLNAVVAKLKELSVKRLIDLGCGEGNLLKLLMKDRQFERIVGMDVSHRALEIADHRLGLGDLPDHQRERISILQGSLIYRDKRMEGFDAATCIEVIEHLDSYRLSTFEKVLFQFARPKSIVLTTPNAEYNCKFEGLANGQFRHKDHRFEWSREEFTVWAKEVASKHNYAVEFWPVGNVDEIVGPPTQMAVFTR